MNNATPNGNNNPFEIFNYKNLGSVRTRLDEHGNPWFCLLDVCNILGIKNNSQLSERLADPYLCSIYVGVQTGFKADGTPAIQNMKMTFINESNLYRVVLGSRKPEAKLFSDWICNEVIPTIRKTGAYITDEILGNMMTQPGFIDFFVDSYIKQREQIKQQQSTINRLQPAADKWNNWLNSPELVTVREGSYIMGIKGMGLINLFRYFRINGFVSNKNVAYKRYIDQELFAVRQIKKLSINGKTMYRLQTFMTHKGIDYFRDRLISEGHEPNEIDFNGVAEYMETEDLTYEQMMECLAA